MINLTTAVQCNADKPSLPKDSRGHTTLAIVPNDASPGTELAGNLLAVPFPAKPATSPYDNYPAVTIYLAL